MSAAAVERGVYEHPYTDAAGSRIVVAVDSRGRLVGQLVVPAGTAVPERATEALRGWLEEVDPVAVRPRLALVVGGAA